MTQERIHKIGYWIGNILLFIGIVLIGYSYFQYYNLGHNQCTKSDLENSTFWKVTISACLMFVILGRRTASSKKIEQKVNKLKMNKKLLIFLGVIGFWIVFISIFILGMKLHSFVEDKITEKIKKQIDIDGVQIKGIVENYSMSFYKRRNTEIQRDKIEFKYILSDDTIHSCYSLNYDQMNKIVIGDTLNFIISKSHPEYIMIEE